MREVLRRTTAILAVSATWVVAAAPQVEWTRTFAGEGTSEGHCVQQTSDGGFIVAGVTDSHPGYPHFYLVKTDSLGNTEWTRAFGHTGEGGAYSVQQTADGGYVVVGSRVLAAWRLAVWLAKIASSGDIEWQKPVSDSAARLDFGFSVVQSGDDGFVVAAVADLSEDSGLALIKTDSLGNGMWTRRYPVPYPDYGPWNPVQLQQTSDGGFIVGARALLKVDSLGNQQWLRTYTGLRNAYSVLQTSDGGYVATGPAPDSGGGHGAIGLLKTNSKGKQQWLRTYAEGKYSRGGYSVVQIDDGGYAIAGAKYDSSYVVRTDPTGAVVWSEALRVGGEAYGIQQTNDGGFVIIENRWDDAVHSDALHLLKLAPEQ